MCFLLFSTVAELVIPMFVTVFQTSRLLSIGQDEMSTGLGSCRGVLTVGGLEAASGSMPSFDANLASVCDLHSQQECTGSSAVIRTCA